MAFSDYIIGGFYGGQVDALEPSLLESHQAEVARNVRIDTVGRLSPRRGQKLINQFSSSNVQGLYSYYYGDELQQRSIVVACGGKLYYGDMNGDFTLLKSELNNQAKFGFETCVNYMVIFNGVDTPLKWDGSSISTLSGAPIGKSPLLYAEKLFVIVDHDTIKWSESFEPEYWPEVNYWDFGKGDGDKLTGLAIYLGDLLIFKKYGIYRLTGTSLDDFRAESVEKMNGAVCQEGIVVYNPYVYYIGERGIFKWNGINSTNIIENTLPNLWKRVNKSALENSCAIDAGDLIWFSLPVDDSEYPNLVLALDPKFDSFWVWDNINASCFITFNDDNFIYTLSGTQDGKLVQQDVGHNDFGEPIESEWVGPEIDGGASSYIKKAKRAFVSDVRGLKEVVFSYRINRKSWLYPSPITDIEDVRRYSISTSFRTFQPRFYHDNLDKDFSITEFNLQYFRVRAK